MPEWLGQKKAAKNRRRVVSQAPPPITPLRTGSIRLTPEPSAGVPTDLPPYYPPSIRLETMVQLGEAVKEFPERSQLELLCRNIVSRLTPILFDAVNQGRVKGHAAPEHLKDLLHYVRVANCENSNERFRIENAVVNSDECREMLKQLAACETERHKSPREVRANDNISRRQQIEAFIQKMLAAGHKVAKKDIWRVAGYKHRTEFERFQREDNRTTTTAAAAFNRVLNMSPDSFMETLAKQKPR